MDIAAVLALTLATTGIIGITLPAVQGIERADGTVAFARSPRLLDAITTFNTVNNRSAKYYFTLELPENAEEPLSKVSISQREGVEDIDFRLDKTLAFEGAPNHRGENLGLQTVTKDEETSAIVVTFDPPIPPGKIFTVGLKPRYNPRYAGVYLFGVTAFPAGEKADGLYLGVGRFHFYRGRDHGVPFL